VTEVRKWTSPRSGPRWRARGIYS